MNPSLLPSLLLFALAASGLAADLSPTAASALSPAADAVLTSTPATEDPGTLPPILVRARRSTLLGDKRLDLVPGGVGLVDMREVEKGRSANLQDLFGMQPGVFVQSRFGAEDARLSIRGSGIERVKAFRGVSLFQDGIPLNRSDGNGDFQMLEPLAIARTEVYRGANAGRLGVASLGGAVNFVSRSGLDSPSSQLRAEAGSFHYLRAQVTTADASDDFDYFATATRYSQDGFRDRSKQASQRFITNWGWRGNEAELRLFGFWLESKSEEPGGLTAEQLRLNPTQAAVANITGGDNRDIRSWRLAAEASLGGEEANLQLTGFYLAKTLAYAQSIVLDQTTADFGGEAMLQLEGRLAGLDHRFMASAGASSGILDDKRYPNLGEGRRGARNADLDRRADNWQVAMEEQLNLPGSLAWTAGFTGGGSVRRQRDCMPAAKNYSFDIEYRSINPRTGLRWDFRPRSQAFANLSRSFEAPTFLEFTSQGISLEPQRATTLETGTRGVEGPLRWELVWYRAWLTNEFLTYSPAPRTPGVTFNTRDSLHEGVESGLTLALWTGAKQGGREPQRVEIQAAYEWNEFNLADDPTYGSSRIPGIPTQFLRGTLRYAHPSGFYVGPSLECSPLPYPVDLANTLFAEPWHTVSAKMGVQTGQGFSWFVDARNLEDRVYAATTAIASRIYADRSNAALFLPGAGRSYYAGVEWRR